MNPQALGLASEFLQHYTHDVDRRWTPQNLGAQRAFVERAIRGCEWLDWSTESGALQIIQANLTSVQTVTKGSFDAVLVAGPVAELVEPGTLFRQAVHHLNASGRVVGIIPCLRENSPESSLFCETAHEVLWPYSTAEELLEMLRDSNLNPNADLHEFVAIPEFSEAILKNKLAFKGFQQVFDRLHEEGYDSTEVGWGELRFVASLSPDHTQARSTP